MTQIDLSNDIMSEIDRRHVTVRPKVYFVMGSLLFGFGVVLSVILATFLISIAYHRFQVIGPLGFLWFGRLGINPLVKTIPWMNLLLPIGLLVLGRWMMTKYDFSYKHNMIGIGSSIVLAVVVTAIAVEATGIHDRLESRRSLQPLYQPVFSDRDWMVGTVIYPLLPNLLVETPSGTTIEIRVTRDTLLPNGSRFSTGERIKAVGDDKGDYFEAIGISKGGMHWRPTTKQNTPQRRGVKIEN